MFDSLSRNTIGVLIGIALLAVAITAGYNSFSSSNDQNMGASVGNDLLIINGAFKTKMAGNTNGAGTLTGLNASSISSDISNFTKTGTGASMKLYSKAFPSVYYTAAPATTTSTNDSIAVTITGMTATAEAQVKAQWSASDSVVTDATVGDGILIITTKF